jgi:hypothetical protein
MPIQIIPSSNISIPPPLDTGGTTDPDNGLQVEVLRAEENVDGITSDRTFYFPTTNWGYYVSFMGPLEAGEEVTFTLGGSPAANISITQVFDRFGTGFDQTAVVEIDIDEYDAAMIGETFTISAETTISGITTATLSFEGVEAPVTPYESAWWGTKYGWFANYHTLAGPPYAATFEYPQYAASGDYHRIYFLTGYVWEDVGNISWVVTQTAGPTRNLYVAHNYAYSWLVTRDLATDYAGTAYSLQMQYDGADFGDPIVLTCEV